MQQAGIAIGLLRVDSYCHISSDLFEKRLFEIYSVLRKNEDAQLEVDKEIIPKVISFGKTILCRTDGPRLMVEWISSLINKIIIRYEFTSNSEDYWIGYYDMIVSNLVELLKEESWAQSQGIWKLFCGKEEIIRDVDIKSLPAGRLPYWIDSTGRKDSVMPLAISALMKGGVGIRVEELVEVMVPWYQAVFLRLKEEPQLSRLGQSGNSVLVDILAWPIAYSKNPTSIIQNLWNEASHIRLRARFARSADDYDYATACNAIVRLGISAHIFISKRKDGKLFSKSIRDILCEYVDEIRYCVPMIGLPNGYDPILILTASISINGLLADNEDCRIFLGHFIGDDEALAKVIVSAAMNGVSKDILKSGLLANGIVLKNLYDSWTMWNNNKIGTRLSNTSDYIKHLSDILL